MAYYSKVSVLIKGILGLLTAMVTIAESEFPKGNQEVPQQKVNTCSSVSSKKKNR
jgi:hypothetical protein